MRAQHSRRPCVDVADVISVCVGETLEYSASPRFLRGVLQPSLAGSDRTESTASGPLTCSVDQVLRSADTVLRQHMSQAFAQ